MKFHRTYLIFLVGIALLSCNEAKISEVEKESTPELEKEIQRSKDSIGDKTNSSTVGEPVKFEDFKKIPTH